MVSLGECGFSSWIDINSMLAISMHLYGGVVLVAEAAAVKQHRPLASKWFPVDPDQLRNLREGIRCNLHFLTNLRH